MTFEEKMGTIISLVIIATFVGFIIYGQTKSPESLLYTGERTESNCHRAKAEKVTITKVQSGSDYIETETFSGTECNGDFYPN